MKQETLFLKIVIFLIGFPILAFCIFWLPLIAHETAANNPEVAYLQYPVLIGVYGTSIPFFMALFQALKLLGYIDRNKAFSELSVKALKHIKYCAISISVMYAAGIPFLILMAEKDDAPGIVVLGLVIIFGSMVIAVFAAVLQKLLENAIAIKYENDLTI
jgi:hypothetical protein